MKNNDDYVVLQQLAPVAILSVQLLIPQLYNYRIIVQLAEVTLIDFCIAPIIAERLVIVKARQRGNYAANSPSPRALARG